jgi:hypothetical protein
MPPLEFSGGGFSDGTKRTRKRKKRQAAARSGEISGRILPKPGILLFWSAVRQCQRRPGGECIYDIVVN